MKHETLNDALGNINQNLRDGKMQPFDEEYYAKQRHCEKIIVAMKKREIPVAPPHPTPHYEGRRVYMANPATDKIRFEKACRDAEIEAKRTGFDIAVFKNRENQYFTWEVRYISSANPVEVLYTAYAPLKEANPDTIWSTIKDIQKNLKR